MESQDKLQWANRPVDQRFSDLDSLIAYTECRRKASSERIVDMTTLEFACNHGELCVFDYQERQLLNVNHWSLLQLAKLCVAPVKYLRTMTAEIARDSLNQCLSLADDEFLQRFNKAFIHKASTRKDRATLSAITSETYGRVYDADVAHQVKIAIEGKSWIIPPDCDRQWSGIFTSDRDMFIFLIDSDDQIEVGNSCFARGFFVSNSEVGASILTVTPFLYDYVRGTHLVYRSKRVREIKMSHSRFAPDRFESDIIPLIEKMSHSAEYEREIKERVNAAMGITLGDVYDFIGVEVFFRSRPFTKAEIRSAFAHIHRDTETVTLWDMIVSLTVHARSIQNMDIRNNLERRAGTLLSTVGILR